MKKITITLISFCICSFGMLLRAQNTIPAAGGGATGSGGSASYSVGQIVYTTNTGTNGSAAQGVQQPYEISVITAVKEANDISLLAIVAYPNPATDFIKLRIENYEVENLAWSLFDINGVMLQNKKIEGEETIIHMNSLMPSIYFLKVLDRNKEIVTYKIIKN
jgi:hypothetical protein